MKQLYLTLFAVLTIVAGANAQAKKLVLIEEFTNASCGPCAAQNPAFNTLLNGNTAKVVAIKYQADFPGYDPMNEQNPDDVEARYTYYVPNVGDRGVPTAIIDGIIPDQSYANGVGLWANAYEGAPAGFNQNVINYASGLSTPLELSMDHQVSTDWDSVYVTVKLKNVGQTILNANNEMRWTLVAVEKIIQFPYAPGTNNETKFESVMRAMYPTAGGAILPGTLGAGDSIVTTLGLKLPSYIYDIRQLAMVGYVQNNTTKAVVNAAISQPKPIVGPVMDGSVTSRTTFPSAFCVSKFTPKVRVKNDGNTDITSFTAAIILSGITATKDWTGTLAPGATVDVDMDEFTATESGNINAFFELRNVKGGAAREVNSLNNGTAPVRVAIMLAEPVGTSFATTLEDDEVAGIPTNSVYTGVTAPGFIFRVCDNRVVGEDRNLGAFGRSGNSIIVNFYQWNPANTGPSAQLTWESVDLTDAEDAWITFDHAHAQYVDASTPLTNDRLKVRISSDCGATWADVWDKAGANLSTAQATDSLYVPWYGEWKADSVNVKQFIGKKIFVQFQAISDWGNMLYIDNINVVGKPKSVSAPSPFDGSISVYPNPSTGPVNIEMNLEETADLTITVHDMTGKLVTVLQDQNTYNQGAHLLTWEGAGYQGMYMIKVKSAKGESTHKVTLF